MERRTTIPVLALLVLSAGGGGCTLATAGTSASHGAGGEETASEISVDNVRVGDTLDVKVSVRNTAPAPLSTQGPPPGYTYEAGESYLTPRFPPQPGRWRVAVGPAGREASDLPYRWGLGGDLAAGASTTVTGRIRLTPELASKRFVAALVQEPPRVSHFGGRWGLIAATPADRAIVVVDQARVYSSPSATSTVLGQVAYGTEVAVVVRSADWFRVRLPDQREGWLVADWTVPARS